MLRVQSVECEGDIEIQGRIVRHTHIKIKVQHTCEINTGKPLLFFRKALIKERSA